MTPPHRHGTEASGQPDFVAGNEFRVSGVGSESRLLQLAHGGHLRPAITYGLDLFAAGMPIEKIVLDVLAPVQRQVGELWETNRWQVADEHAATAVIDGVLGALSLETVLPDDSRGDVLVACAEGEHHTMPARMGVEILRAEGWGVTFLGGSFPADDLQRIAAEREPDVVVLSCTVPLFLAGARRGFTALAELGLPALAAGAAFGGNGYRALRLGARGWLGPGIDLSGLLEDSLHYEPRACPCPPEAVALELDHAALRDSCMSRMVEQMPAVRNFSPAQLNSTRVDLDYVLGFLTAAVDLDDDDIFASFRSWLSRVLGSRGLPPSVLHESLRYVGEVMEAADMPHAARLCAPNP